jgi:hypothetical protein
LAKITKRVATLFFKFFYHFFLKNSQNYANNYQKSTDELIFWLFFQFLPNKLAKIFKIAFFWQIPAIFMPISGQ